MAAKIEGRAPRLFISYRRADSQYLAVQLVSWLRRRYGKNSVFFDIDTIGAGEDFRFRIDQEVQATDVVIALVGPSWTASVRRDDDSWVREELLAAGRHGRPVIPVLHANQPMPSSQEVPEELDWFATLNAFSLGEPKKLQRDFRRLSQHVEQQIGIQRQWSRISARVIRGKRLVATGVLGAIVFGASATALFVSGDEQLSGDSSFKSSATAMLAEPRPATADPADAPHETEPPKPTAPSGSITPLPSDEPSTVVDTAATALATSTTATVTQLSTIATTTPSTITTTTTTSTTTVPTTTSTAPPTPTTTDFAPVTTVAPPPTTSPAPVYIGTSIASVKASGMEECQHFDDLQLVCGNGISLRDISAVALGRFHSCALTTAGEVWCWRIADWLGDYLTGWTADDKHTPTLVSLPTSATDIAIGSDTASFANDAHTCAVLADTTVRCWGENSHGQLGINPSETDINSTAVPNVANAAKVVTGNMSTCALLIDGSVTCWGGVRGETRFFDPGLPLPLTEIVTCCELDWSPTYFGRDTNGGIWAWDRERAAREVSTPDALSDIAANKDRVCGITVSGNVVCSDLVSNSIPESVQGVPTAFWNPGVRITGSPRGTSIFVETDVGEHWDLFSGNQPIESYAR